MEAILKLFGEYFFKFCKMSGYDRMLWTLGGNLTEFIENLDALHSYLAHSYQVSPSGSELSGPERKQVLLAVLGHLATSPKRLQLPGACESLVHGISGLSFLGGQMENENLLATFINWLQWSKKGKLERSTLCW